MICNKGMVDCLELREIGALPREVMFDLNPKDSGKFKWAEGKGERGCRVSRVEHNMCTGSGAT